MYFVSRRAVEHFNPRSREGSDAFRAYLAVQRALFQSTLPRRERPVVPAKLLYFFVYFNPRSREGSDDTRTHMVSSRYEFQSTLPRRERPRYSTRSAG